MGLTLISFYTDDYTKHATTFKAKCEEFSIPHRLTKLESTGTWLGNTRLKPLFILSEVRLHGPCLWVDIDSVLCGNPMAQCDNGLADHDAAFVGYQNWKKRPYPTNVCKDPVDVLLRMFGYVHAWSGSPASIRLLEQWCEECSNEQGRKLGDHRLMQYAIDKLHVAGEIDYGWLPIPLKEIIRVQRMPTGFSARPRSKP